MKTQANRTAWRSAGLILAIPTFAVSALAQSYTIDRSTISAGGLTSTGSVYSVRATIAQPDAGASMSGASFSVSGGFWALVQALPTPGAPALSIWEENGAVTVSWPNVAGWNLVQSTNAALPSASWSESPSPALSNGTNYLKLVHPAGMRFYRLRQ